MGRPKVPPPPYAIIAKVAFGSLRTMRIPEAWIPRVLPHEWKVLIKDSDMAGVQTPKAMDMRRLQSNPRRHADDGPDDGA